MTLRSAAAAFALGGTLAGCAPHAPQIGYIRRVEAYCKPKEARPTSMASVLTSIQDAVADPYPRLPEIRREVRALGGAIGYWDATSAGVAVPGADDVSPVAQDAGGDKTAPDDRPHDQLLLEPDLAKQFGEPGDYIRVDAIAIPTAPQLPPGDNAIPIRRVYLQVKDHGIARWIGVEAYDVQNVCVEGKIQQ